MENQNKTFEDLIKIIENSKKKEDTFIVKIKKNRKILDGHISLTFDFKNNIIENYPKRK